MKSIKFECMKKWLLFGILFFNVVLVILVLSNFIPKQPEYIAPNGYKRLTKEKEEYMLYLMDIPNKLSWRVYANRNRNFIYCCYKNGKWHTPDMKEPEVMALYNAFGDRSNHYRSAFYSISGELSTNGFPPPISNMENIWRKNKEEFSQGKWFR